MRCDCLRRCFLGFVWLMCVCLPASAQEGLSGDPEIIAPDARLEELFTSTLLAEGAAVAPDGSVYFSEITFTFQSEMEAGHIWKYDSETGETKIFRSPSGMSNGIKFDAQGRMIVAEGADYGGRRVTRTDLKTGKAEIIAGLFDGRPFNAPNDITIDKKGRIYFSDPRYLGHEPVEQATMAVYRIDPDGSVHRIVTDAGKPNGVALSPDEKTLYVVSNDNGALAFDRMSLTTPTHLGRMALLAYDLAEDGTAKFREVLVDYAPQAGPDGLVVDVEGNLYVAGRDITRPGIYVYSPKGKERAYIPIPASSKVASGQGEYNPLLYVPVGASLYALPTNVAFGRGERSKLLYITAGASLYSIWMKKDGYQLPSE